MAKAKEAAADPEAAGGTVTRAHRLDATPDTITRCGRLRRMLRSRLFWAKFWLVATGVWWGVCMQLLFYQGAGHPLAQLPNLDWYLGMSLVYFHRARHCFRPDAAYASVKQRHVVPIAICDYLGTVGTTIGLEVALLDACVRRVGPEAVACAVEVHERHAEVPVLSLIHI